MVITAPENVTPDWMTSVLHRNGVALDARVSAVEVILRKELPVSTVCRLGISYQSAAIESERPRSLFLKLPRVSNATTGMVPGDHRSEVQFYREVAPRIGCPPIIRGYDTESSEESKRSHIVLDDLTETHLQPQQEHAPSIEMSRLAVAALARAHAA